MNNLAHAVLCALLTVAYSNGKYFDYILYGAIHMLRGHWGGGGGGVKNCPRGIWVGPYTYYTNYENSVFMYIRPSYLLISKLKKDQDICIHTGSGERLNKRCVH